MPKSFKKLPPSILRKHKGISYAGITTCFMVHDGKGSFYMAKRSKKARDEHGTWEVGGGGLKWGQTAEGNALREAFEEFNAKPIRTEFLGYRDIFRQLPGGTPTHWVGLDYAVLVDPKIIRVKEKDQFDDAGWFQLDNLPSPLHSQEGIFFDQYSKQLKKILGKKSKLREIKKFLFS